MFGGGVFVCSAHVFDKLRADPGMHPVLVAEAAGVPAGVSASQREEVAEIMFEGFGVPSLCTASSPLLALLSLGEATGTARRAGCCCNNRSNFGPAALLRFNMAIFSLPDISSRQMYCLCRVHDA